LKRLSSFIAKDPIRPVEWRNWKMHLLWETEPSMGVTQGHATSSFGSSQPGH
jgi:hypothetical protein